MQQLNDIPQYNKTHYAVVDLGSNSFHLLISQLSGQTIQTVNKVKRKVRLASGLDHFDQLSDESITRGLDCLALFAGHLINIPKDNIRIVATATLRIAKNRDDFLIAANKILPKKIQLLSGEQEAETIYSGVAHSCLACNQQKRLVIDIGGASTELIIGEAHQAKKVVSLNIGCVSFKEKYFQDNLLNGENFTAAIIAASTMIKPIADDFKTLGWQITVGSSGIMQALAEILQYRQQSLIITAKFLQEIKHSLTSYKNIDAIAFDGLRADRNPVMASGLSILIALFNCLNIQEMTLSTGALREGLLYEMLPHTSQLT
ncbi:MAG: phosphatase [Colwellia sp.]